MSRGRSTVAALVIAFSLVAMTHAQAECITPPLAREASAPDDSAAGATQRDRQGRVVAPISVNGQGPFRFIVDTGANRSALSPQLASRLGLAPVGTAEVHTIEGVLTSPLVPIQTMNYQRLTLPTAPIPVLQNARVLAGEDGLLGVDGMLNRRLRMDFRRHCIEIIPSRGAGRLRNDWVEVDGELRFGSVVVIRGSIRNVEMNLLLDTGADISLGNAALRDALAPIRLRETDGDLGRALTAGRPILLDRAVIMPRLAIGEVIEIANVTAFLTDLDIVSLWGFEHEPTLLIGMDVIGQTQGLAIDYGRAKVYFSLPRSPAIR